MTDKKRNSSYRNSGNRNSGYMNSGDWNAGDMNSGDWNSGIFNTNEPKARFFNKETDMTLTEFYNSNMCPSWNDLPLNRWVNKNDMSKKEKEEINGWEEMGGYLKTLEYAEAWKVFWAETSEDNRKKFLNLPNFSWEIFTSVTGIEPQTKNPKEITGIDVEAKDTVKIGDYTYDKADVEKRLKDIKPINN